MILAQRTGMFDPGKTDTLIPASERVGKMLNALIKAVKAHRPAA
jgi:hypothetical protein